VTVADHGLLRWRWSERDLLCQRALMMACRHAVPNIVEHLVRSVRVPVSALYEEDGCVMSLIMMINMWCMVPA
jgi:hypothetical protein